MSRLAVFVVILVSITLGAGCGVPADREPASIPEDQIPFDLLGPSTTLTVTTLPVASEPLTLYMIRNDRLAAVTRTVASPPTLGNVLSAVIQGTTDAETANGLRSAVNSQASLLSAQITDGIASVNLNDAFSGLGLQDQILAVAQLTYAATEMSGVTGVRILINSVPADMPRGDGATTKEPLVRSDYVQVAPLSSER